MLWMNEQWYHRILPDCLTSPQAHMTSPDYLYIIQDIRIGDSIQLYVQPTKHSSHTELHVGPAGVAQKYSLQGVKQRALSPKLHSAHFTSEVVVDTRSHKHVTLFRRHTRCSIEYTRVRPPNSTTYIGITSQNGMCHHLEVSLPSSKDVYPSPHVPLQPYHSFPTGPRYPANVPLFFCLQICHGTKIYIPCGSHKVWSYSQHSPCSRAIGRDSTIAIPRSMICK